MSRNNKVNPDHYTMAGRLSADDLARERMRQGEQQPGGGRRRGRKAMPPWMANQSPAADASREANDEAGSNTAARAVEGGDEGAGMPRRQAAQKRGADVPRKGKRPAPRPRAGETPGMPRRKSTKASGARGTPRTRTAPSARGTGARGASAERAGRPVARKGRIKGSGTPRQAQKKGGRKTAKQGSRKTAKKAAANTRKR